MNKTKELKNGDVCLAKLHGNWNAINIVLAVFYKGEFYDTQVKEDDCLEQDMWCISEYIDSVEFTGENVKDLTPNVKH
jgi:hypothetical protein